LYSGVVKYPYTPNPWEKWNVFIFWHSSYYWWKHNPYGTIFAKIPILKKGDKIIVEWKWRVYSYSVIKKYVLRPRQVDKIYKKYMNGYYLSIMACYPIWSDRKRMVIIATKD
jgi:LPXTG-site transpeptidase (sortase) family protein